MSIDAALSGRQKKWKYMIIMMFLAILSLVTAMGIQKKDLLFSSLPVGEGDVIWSEVSAGRDARTSVTDSGIYLLTKGRLTNLKDSPGGMGQTVPGDTMEGGFCLAVFEALGRELYLPENGEVISFSGSILSVSVGKESYLSAIISASGYRTKTVVFTEQGEIIGEIPLRDKTMVESVFLKEDSLLAALCLTDGGDWECLLYTPEGKLLHSADLRCAVCYELLPLGEYVGIRTGNGIQVISHEGKLVSEISGTIDLWTVSEHYIACVAGDQLKTYTPEGDLLGEAVLPYYPKHISALGNRIYIHYGEGIGCYHPTGELLWFRREGSMAYALQPFSCGCVLIPFLENW